MAHNIGFLELFQQIEQNPLNILLKREQIEALKNKLPGTPLCEFLEDCRHPRIWIHLAGNTPVYRVIQNRRLNKDGPLAFDMTFSFDGNVVTGNIPELTNTNNKKSVFNVAIDTLATQLHQSPINNITKQKQY